MTGGPASDGGGTITPPPRLQIVLTELATDDVCIPPAMAFKINPTRAPRGVVASGGPGRFAIKRDDPEKSAVLPLTTEPAPAFPAGRVR